MGKRDMKSVLCIILTLVQRGVTMEGFENELGQLSQPHCRGFIDHHDKNVFREEHTDGVYTDTLGLLRDMRGSLHISDKTAAP